MSFYVYMLTFFINWALHCSNVINISWPFSFHVMLCWCLASMCIPYNVGAQCILYKVS